MDRMRIAVLMGGISSEREISLRSGKAVTDALKKAGHDVFPVDLRAEDISPIEHIEIDVVFPALHGRFGEDGVLQAMLDEADIPYVGSDSHASRAAMDKMASKCFFITHDVPTPPFRLVTTSQHWPEIEQVIEDVTLPLVVKPLRQGSSLGVTMASTLEDVAMGLASAFHYGHQALLERLIPGREFTVGVLGQEALPVIELRPKRAFFDYYAKYEDKATEFVVDPDLPDRQKSELQRIALEAHRALGCEDLSRVDMMVEEADGCPYVLETNTIPGFTERSLYPKAAKAAGIEFPELCERLCRGAIEARRAGSVTA